MRTLSIVILSGILTACGGSKGDPGAQGPAGIAGPQGQAGTSGLTVLSDTKCDGTNMTLSFGYTYEIIKFVGGAKFVSCSIFNASAQYSNSLFWPVSQNGNTAAACLLVADIDSASNGYWTFTENGSARQAVYNDPSSPNNNHVETISTCTTN